MATTTLPRSEKPGTAEGGDPAALLARSQDLSRRLEEREEFYRSFMESLAEGVIITDHEGRVLYANSRVECLTGYPRSELLGRISYEALSPKEEWPVMRRRLKERLAGKEETYEYEHVRQDGGRHWVAVRALPYRNGAGRVVGTIGLISCIKERKTLEQENQYLHEELRGEYRAILGHSPALKKVLAQIEMVAPTNAGVLILGESGTGKELAARAIHDRSPRREAALVRVNCASVPRELFESEFFGHVRGAFTGAVKDRVGRFELAQGGTLFLDEIGEVPPELQSKLLRVLQEGQFEKVGEDRTRSVDVRIIAATNRDLEAEVRSGRFRQDLYYRLSVFPIELPPLRDRVEDIPVLAQHFLGESARKLGVAAPSFTPGHLRELQSYDWPGNIRELQNVIERAVIRSRDGRLDLGLASGTALRSAVRPASARPVPAPSSLAGIRNQERELIVDALARTRGKIYGVDGAAALLGLKPTTLSSKVHRMGLKQRAFTRMEALVIGVGAALLALVALPTWGGYRTGGDQQGCLANFRQLNRAWLVYAEDHAGQLPGNLDGGEAMSVANTNRTWAVGWLDLTTSPVNTNTALLRNSQLGAYVDSVSVYRCPADASRRAGGAGELRVRSVGMNSYIGSRPAPWTTGYRVFTSLTSIVDPSPSECLVFVDEREESLNDACFLISMEGYDPVQPTRTTIVDFPAMRHDGGATMSFADGHVESWRWLDARTRPGRRPGQSLALNVPQPNNLDVQRIQRSASRRVTSVP